jgi:CRP-like cAMP-binding protein
MFMRRENDKAEAIRTVSLFAGSSPRERRRLATLMDEVSVAAGDVVIRQGRRERALYILLEGEMELTMNGVPICRFGPGDFFGEISLRTHGPARGTVAAVKDSQVLALSPEQFRDAFLGDPILIGRIDAAMGARLQQNSTPAAFENAV